MGDNANVRDREWHNTIVGQGYQARGVIRQPGLHQATKIVDMTGQSAKPSTIESISTKETIIPEDNSSKKHKRKEDKKEKSKKSSKHKKRKHEKNDTDRNKQEENADRFNPLIQLLLSKFPN